MTSSSGSKGLFGFCLSPGMLPVSFHLITHSFDKKCEAEAASPNIAYWALNESLGALAAAGVAYSMAVHVL